MKGLGLTQNEKQRAYRRLRYGARTAEPIIGHHAPSEQHDSADGRIPRVCRCSAQVPAYAQTRKQGSHHNIQPVQPSGEKAA